jgi:pyrroline-5-carboxylate reductase
MPNTPALVGQGMAGLCRGRHATARDAETVRSIFKAVGEAVVVEEQVMDAITGLSGSGPAFVYMFIEALADGGVAAGLARTDALALAAQTVKGAASMVQQTGRHPGELKDAVASPGGTTMAGIRELERSGFRSSIIEAVVAATRRSAELAPPDQPPAGEIRTAPSPDPDRRRARPRETRTRSS